MTMFVHVNKSHDQPRFRSSTSAPNFFLVGAPKSATTSLYHYLHQHPDVYMAIPKEPLYFGTDLHTHKLRTRSKREYQSYFEPGRDCPRRGDATVWYLYSSRAAREIHRFCPEARIIIILRHPVEAMHAMHSQFLLTGNENLTSFRQAVEAEPSRKRGRRIPPGCYFRQGLYYSEVFDYTPQIRRYLDVFEREQIKIIRFTNFAQHTARCFRSVLEFLDLDPEFEPSFRRHNPNGQLRPSFLRRLVRRVPGDTKAVLKQIIPVQSCVKLWRNIAPLMIEQTSRPSPKKSFQDRLVRQFKPSIKRLERLLERDFSGWLKPPGNGS